MFDEHCITKTNKNIRAVHIEMTKLCAGNKKSMLILCIQSREALKQENIL